MATFDEQFSLYEEYSKMYDKRLMKLMRLSNKAIIEKNCAAFEAEANEYLAKFKNMDAVPYYTERINENILGIRKSFLK